MIEFSVTCEVSGVTTLCNLVYDESKPAEIKMVFYYADGDIEWIISRELLKDVLENGKSGQGECLLYLKDEIVQIIFISPHGRGVADFSRATIKHFVHDMYELVPYGSDVYDMSDETLQNWLDSFA